MRVRLHAFASRVPVGWTDFPVLVGELAGLQDAQGLVDRAANRQIVDGGVTDEAFRVDEEEPAEGNRVIDQHAVRARNVLVKVRDKGKGHRLQTTLAAGRVAPGQVGVLGVHADAQDFGAKGSEVVDAVAKGDELRGTDECEIERVEDENHVLSVVVGEGKRLDFAIDNGLGSEIGCWVGY